MTSLNNITIPKVIELYLKDNKLTDEVVEELVGMKLSQVKTINLERNAIENVQQAITRLKAAYPTTEIIA